MACPSWENLGIFKNYALSKLEVLGQWVNFLDFKHLPKAFSKHFQTHKAQRYFKMSKPEVLGQWLNFLDFKHLSKIIKDL